MDIFEIFLSSPYSQSDVIFKIPKKYVLYG